MLFIQEMRPYQLPADNMLNNQQSGLGLGVSIRILVIYRIVQYDFPAMCSD